MDRVGLPTRAVIMSTCAREGMRGGLRASYAEQAIASLASLRYDGPMRLHFADDGSSPLHMTKLVFYGGDVQDWTGITMTDADGQGFGKSLNMAVDFLDSDLVFYLPDDWVLTAELDLTIPAQILDNPSIGMVRTGMIHPDLYAKSVYGGPELQYYWVLDKMRGGFAMSFRTFLTHRRFWDHYGPLPEGLDIYNTERAYNEHVRGLDGPAIAYAGNVGLTWPWRHIGEVACSGEGLA